MLGIVYCHVRLAVGWDYSRHWVILPVPVPCICVMIT